MADEFEIVCTPSTLPLGEALEFLLYCGPASPPLCSLTLLSSEEGSAFFSSGGSGQGLFPPRFPVLYDNVHSLELTLPLAALKYAAHAGGLAPSGEARGDVLAEVCCGWLGAPSGEAGEGARRCSMLQGLLTRYTHAPAEGEGGPAPTITYGDLLAWLCLDTEVRKWGAAAALQACTPMMAALHEVTGRRRGVAAFVAAREARRQRSSSGLAEAATTSTAASQQPPPAAATAASPAPPPPGSAIAVTGAGGFLASWIVKTLLELGHTVHGTVRSLQEPAAWGHLLDLPGAGGSEHLAAALASGHSPLVSGRLRLYAADLLQGPGAFAAPLARCHTVIHTASPYDVAAPRAAQEGPASPSLLGTLAVLQAAEAAPALRRIVLTSSAAAVYVGRQRGDHVYSEADWSDPALLEAAGSWYALGKLAAERAAWAFLLSQRHVAAREALGAPPLTMAAVCPTQCIGPLLAPRLNQSSALLLEYASGARAAVPVKSKCLVDVREAALAHVLACAGGGGAPRLARDGSGRQTHPERYLLVAGSLPWKAITDALRGALPKGSAVPRELEREDAPPCLPQALCSQVASHRLGVRYRPMEVSIAEAAQSFLEWGMLEGSGSGGSGSGKAAGPRVLSREEAAAALAGASPTEVAALFEVPPSADCSASFPTPLLAPGGSCAVSEELAPQAFPVLDTLTALLPAGAPSPRPLLVQLKGACQALAARLGVDWVGVYVVVPPAPQHALMYGASASAPNLLKLAYTGSVSRAYFPLTPEFAAGSNNSTVGLQGCTVVIEDTAALAGDAPYYNCDGKVRSEVCTPIWGEGGRLLGIVDAEAFAVAAFDASALQAVLGFAQHLSGLLGGLQLGRQ